MDDVHIRADVETNTLYISGTGTVYGTDYGNYTPVNVVVEEGIIGIGDSAFFNCNGLISVTLPDSLESIGDVAFESCSSLTEVTLGAGLTEIFPSIFNKCSALTKIKALSSLQEEVVKAGMDLTLFEWY